MKKKSLTLDQNKRPIDKKRVTGIVIWSVIYTILGACSLFLIVYAFAYANLSRSMKTTTWVSDIRTAFNEWRGVSYYVEIWNWIIASIIIVNGLIVALLIINDNRAKTYKKKQALRNLK